MAASGATSSTWTRGQELLTTLLVFALYSLGSLAAYWPLLPGTNSRVIQEGGDPSLSTWMLAWVPYALTHGRNPFFSLSLNYPYGVNLAQNTAMPLLGLIMAPITALDGPIATYNLLMWLAYPLSGIAMYVVIRRVTGSHVAGFAGGLLYGFSAYIVGEGEGHLHMSFVPMPPLIFYVLYRIVLGEHARPLRDGVLLGLLIVAQYFISSEIAATTVMLGALGTLVYFIVERRQLSRERLHSWLKTTAAAVVPAATFLAYPLYFTLRGPQHFTGSIFGPNNTFRNILIGAIAPTAGQRLHISPLSHYGAAINFVEDGSFIGVPLLVLAALMIFWFRTDRRFWLLGGLAVFAYVLGLGSRLGITKVGGTVPLPFTLLAKVPLLDNALPSRFALYEVLFVAVIVGIGAGHLITGSRQPKPILTFEALIPSAVPIVVSALLGVAAVVTLLPNWPDHTTKSVVPKFFSSSLVTQIPLGTPVLVYPYPVVPMNQAMTWQADAKMRFKLMGGYALFSAGPHGHATFQAWDDPAVVPEYLAALETPSEYQMPSVTDAEIITELKVFVAKYTVSSVVATVSDSAVPNMARAVGVFDAAFGHPTSEGGVLLWRT